MNQKHVFWEALVLAIFIFCVGLFLGYLIELNRTSNIVETYQNLEVELLDVTLQKDILLSENIECEDAISELIRFADRIYIEAVVLDRYDGSARLSKGLTFQYKKFSLLRGILWENSIKVTERCEEFHTIIYFNERLPSKIEIDAEQQVFSNYLDELKKKYGQEVVLIPISTNLNISSIDLTLKRYGINKTPTILVDEQYKVDEISELDRVESYLTSR